MNEQLKKAIQEATRVEPWSVPRSIMVGCDYAVDEIDHNASQAKLLRVIELLLKQRDTAYVCPLDKDLGSMIAGDNAELVKVLSEGEK